MIKFANKNLPSFVKVTDTRYSILPPVESKSEKIYGRAGAYDFGIEIGSREFEVDIMIIAQDQHDVIKKARELSTWLLYKDLQPLIILDEPDKQYQARFVGESVVNELFKTGSTTLKFLCPSAYAESVIPKEVLASPTDTTPINITNSGSAETYPVIDLTLKEDIPSVAVVSKDKFVLLGYEDLPEKTKVIKDPIVLNDHMTTLTGWTSGVSVDNGSITGAFSSTGVYFQQANKDYGSGSTWHGGAMIRSLPRTLTNFEVQGTLALKSSDKKQLGRVEMYLLDANNLVIGKIGLTDPTTTGEFAVFSCRAGDSASGKEIFNSSSKKKGVFGDFYGVMKVTRVGRRWSVYVSQVDSKGRHTTKLTGTWYDTNNTFSTKQLAKIQVHIGAFGTNAPVNTMYFSDLKVWEKTTVDSSVNVPVGFKTGDVITIDNERAIVLKNGEQIYSELDPSSDFFPLESGVNGLIFTPPEALEISVQYRERWL